MNAKILMSLFISVLMVLSIAGFVMSDADDGSKRFFGDFVFYRTSEGWQSRIDGRDVFFNYVPDEVSDIVVDDVSRSVLTSSPVLGISYDPAVGFLSGVGEVQFYLEQVLSEGEKMFVVRGVSNISRYPSLPLLSCVNSSQSFPVLMFVQGNETRIVSKDWCLMAEAKSVRDLFRLSDRIIFAFLGVL